jgi:ankyrin repeat protein
MSLIEAVNEGNIDRISQLAQNTDLINRFESIEQPPDSGHFMNLTPLLLAVMRENPDVVRILLEKGADPNLRNEDGVSPLIVAAENGNIEYVQMLLGYGATVSNNVYNYIEPGSIINNTIRSVSNPSSSTPSSSAIVTFGGGKTRRKQIRMRRRRRTTKNRSYWKSQAEKYRALKRIYNRV